MKTSRWKDLQQRLLVSLGIVIVLVGLIVFSSYLIVSILVSLVVATMAALGVWEYRNLVLAKGLNPSRILMMGIAVLQVLSFFVVHKFFRFPELPIFVLFFGLCVFFINHFRTSGNALLNVAVEFFSIAYIAIPLGFMLGVLFPVSNLTLQEGRWWIVYLILVTKITDIGAYFVGRFFGKKPLAPVLSPKKTVEGACAGFICALGASLAMSHFYPMHLKIFDALWLGALIGVLGQLGDLAESMLKRDALVKDSNVLPGIGGILDMIDSLIFTAPVIYFYLKWTA